MAHLPTCLAALQWERPQGSSKESVLCVYMGHNNQQAQDEVWKLRAANQVDNDNCKKRLQSWHQTLLC